MGAEERSSLYEKYGGAPTISRVVHVFYSKVMRSEELRPFFAQVNMEQVMQHQIDLFSHLMGGPIRFEMSRLEHGHRNLAIQNHHFDEVAELLGETLEEAGVELVDVEFLLKILEGARSMIVRTQE